MVEKPAHGLARVAGRKRPRQLFQAGDGDAFAGKDLHGLRLFICLRLRRADRLKLRLDVKLIAQKKAGTSASGNSEKRDNGLLAPNLNSRRSSSDNADGAATARPSATISSNSSNSVRRFSDWQISPTARSKIGVK